MPEDQTVAIIGAVAAATVAILGAVAALWRAVHGTHQLVNSRMDELITTTRSLGEAKGRAESPPRGVAEGWPPRDRSIE